MKKEGEKTSNIEFREAGVSRPGESRGVCRLLTVRVGRGMRFYERTLAVKGRQVKWLLFPARQ